MIGQCQCNDYGGCDRACKIARLVRHYGNVVALDGRWNDALFAVVMSGGWWWVCCVLCADFTCAVSGICMVDTFRCQKDFLRRATPFDTSVLGCQKVSKGVERCRWQFQSFSKKLTTTFCVKLLFTR